MILHISYRLIALGLIVLSLAYIFVPNIYSKITTGGGGTYPVQIHTLVDLKDSRHAHFLLGYSPNHRWLIYFTPTTTLGVYDLKEKRFTTLQIPLSAPDNVLGFGTVSLNQWTTDSTYFFIDVSQEQKRHELKGLSGTTYERLAVDMNDGNPRIVPLPHYPNEMKKDFSTGSDLNNYNNSEWATSLLLRFSSINSSYFIPTPDGSGHILSSNWYDFFVTNDQSTGILTKGLNKDEDKIDSQLHFLDFTTMHERTVSAYPSDGAQIYQASISSDKKYALYRIYTFFGLYRGWYLLDLNAPEGTLPKKIPSLNFSTEFMENGNRYVWGANSKTLYGITTDNKLIEVSL